VAIGEDVADLIVDLIDTQMAHDGVGIAAPQVGVSKRVIIVGSHGDQLVLINPVIIQRSREINDAIEGCLSLPGIYRNVWRSHRVIVEFTSQGGHRTMELEGFDAIVAQHEIDHLEGRLIIDYPAGQDLIRLS
jgi:peptide deformylase